MPSIHVVTRPSVVIAVEDIFVGDHRSLATCFIVHVGVLYQRVWSLHLLQGSGVPWKNTSKNSARRVQLLVETKPETRDSVSRDSTTS